MAPFPCFPTAWFKRESTAAVFSGWSLGKTTVARNDVVPCFGKTFCVWSVKEQTEHKLSNAKKMHAQDMIALISNFVPIVLHTPSYIEGTIKIIHYILEFQCLATVLLYLDATRSPTHHCYHLQEISEYATLWKLHSNSPTPCVCKSTNPGTSKWVESCWRSELPQGSCDIAVMTLSFIVT